MSLMSITTLILQNSALVKNFKVTYFIPFMLKLQDVKNFDFSKRYKCEYYRHNYDQSIEHAMNKQIQDEFNAGYSYLDIATYFARSDIAMPGMHGFFMKMFYEELEHGLGFIKYQNLRGGKVILSPLESTGSKVMDVKDAFATGLDMEKTIKMKLQNIYVKATDLGDTDVCDFLDGYLKNQEKSIQEMARYYTRATQLSSDSIGNYLFDRELHHTHVRKVPTEHTPEMGNLFYA